MKRFAKFIGIILLNSIILTNVGCASKDSANTPMHTPGRVPEFLQRIDPQKIEDLKNKNIENVISTAEEFACDITEDKDYTIPHKAILDTISYRIDRDSISYDGEHAYVDIIFTMANYESVLLDEDNLRDINTFTTALNKIDKINIKSTLSFTRSNGMWVLNNGEDTEASVLEFLDTGIVFIPAPTPPESLDLSGCNYTAAVNYKEYFDYTLCTELGSTIVLTGDLNIYLYLSIDDETASIVLDKDLLMTDIRNYVITNADVIVEASTGMSLSTVKMFTGMTDDEVYDMIMDEVMVEINKINFDLFSMSGTYEIDGDSIVIHGSQGDIPGTISGNTIYMDITNNHSIDEYLEENELVFDFTSVV